MALVGSKLSKLSGLTFVQGPEVDVNPGESGAITVLEFWATWCPPCVQSIPHLSEVYNRLKTSAKIDLVGITNEQDVGKIEKFVQKMGPKMAYPVAIDGKLDGQNLVQRPAGARGIPFAVIAGVDGKVVWQGHPMDPEFETQLEKQVKAFNEAPPKPQEALPLITETYDELMTKKAKELQQILDDRKIPRADCIEKSDLAKRIVEKASTIIYYA